MAEQISVLLVDDEEDLLEVLADDISTLGFKITTAPNGKEALRIITETVNNGGWFDAILSDINMPHMNGLQLLEKIRELKIDIPFVFLSGYGDKEKAITAMRLGALDFLEKPYQRDALLGTMKKATELGRSMYGIDKEIKEALSMEGVDSAQVPNLYEVSKAIIRMKRMNKIYFGKKN